MNSLRKNDIITLILAIVLFGVLQFLMAERIIGSFWELNIFLVCVNIIMAASLNLINGYTGQFSLGHAGFMAVGAYVGVILTVNFHSPFIVALLIGGFAAGILGFLIGLPTLRLKGDYLAIATLGLGEIIRIVIMNIEYVGGAAGFKGIPHNTTFPWVFFIMLFTLFFIKNFVSSNKFINFSSYEIIQYNLFFVNKLVQPLFDIIFSYILCNLFQMIQFVAIIF